MSDNDNMLKKIEEGMKVYDNTGDKIGTVEFIHFSEANGSEHTGAAAPPSEPVRLDPIEILRKVFGADNLPEEMRERLLMQGFIKIDSAKLFGADRYVMLDQISKVDEDGVHLTVEDSEGLLKG
jgi:hypothetical protein